MSSFTVRRPPPHLQTNHRRRDLGHNRQRLVRPTPLRPLLEVLEEKTRNGILSTLAPVAKVHVLWKTEIAKDVAKALNVSGRTIVR